MELKAGGYISLSTWSIALAKGSKAAAAKLRKERDGTDGDTQGRGAANAACFLSQLCARDCKHHCCAVCNMRPTSLQGPLSPLLAPHPLPFVFPKPLPPLTALPPFAHLFSHALCIVPSAFALTLLAAIHACGIVAAPRNPCSTPPTPLSCCACTASVLIVVVVVVMCLIHLAAGRRRASFRAFCSCARTG